MKTRVSRRRVMASAMFGPAAALAQNTVQKPAKTWSNEYWAQKGVVKLYMFRKRATPPKTGEKPLPVLLLIHGSSNSSRSSFDLATPGKGEYSVMNVFAEFGYDVWTMDHENYGRSSQTQGNSDIASGVKDIQAGMDVIARETVGKKCISLESHPEGSGPARTPWPNLVAWTAWCWEHSPTRETILRRWPSAPRIWITTAPTTAACATAT